jgi:FtsP/CotA-like multicopper oxidase with cupredoxin domain
MKTRILSRGGPVTLMAAAFLLGTGVGLPAIAEEKDPAQAKREARLADPDHGQMRRTTPGQRQAARLKQAAPKTGVSKSFAGVNPANAKFSPLVSGRSALATMAPPLSTPDYFGIANWANSPLPTALMPSSPASVTATVVGGVITGFTIGTPGAGYVLPSVTITDPTGSGAYATATANTNGAITAVTLGSLGGGTGYTAPVVTITGITPGTGIGKFKDLLPGLCGISPWGAAGANDLGQCIPVATKFATPPVGVPNDADYYEIGLSDYSRKMHFDLPVTKLRGYTDLNPASTSFGVNQYLGPLILATKGRPVRVKFTNKLGLGPAGNLFIPTDITYMGAGNGPDGTPYAQNRATLHLHGGNTPWISDGTPHQWTVPFGGTTANNSNFLKGLSARDVPDMPATKTGELTFYWTNQQGGRLMFYHDHAYGMTRLNVYAGEAAGYLLVDPAEENLLAAATVPGTIGATPDLVHVVPLVIQDKTFVPDSGVAGGQLAATDPTWDVTKFGGAGSLWFPHVYMPNQNPYDISGANPFGRWDWGPWFWPPQNPSTLVSGAQPCQSVAYPGAWLTCPGTPNPSGTPEAFMDTMVVNGTAYPTLPVAPAAYRFQILSAGNDRTLNLGLYYAVDKVNGVPCKAPNAFTPANCTEVGMLPAIPHTNPATTFDTLPSCTTNPTTPSGAMLAIAALDPTGNPLNGTGLQTACWPSTWPTDGRDGGVPDPRTAGPPLIQIGTEGGLLPSPAVIPSTPMNYEYNRRSITVLNVFTHGLTLGPAERADVVVDFSSVPSGSVLILYNDGPAPVPAFDPRSDYYTGDPDQTSTGGAPSTIAGFGPNTRTVMQIQVGQANPNTTAFSLPSLTAALPNIFAATQDKIIVPENAYPAANGGSLNNQNNYARIQDTSLAFWTGGPVGGVAIAPPSYGGGAYAGPPAVGPTVTIAAPTGTCPVLNPCATATASAVLAPGVVRLVNVTAGGTNYKTAPNVTLTGGGGSGATAQVVGISATSLLTINVGNGGSGYTTAPTVVIPAPTCLPIPSATCRQAVATATVTGGGKVNKVNVTTTGLGYTFIPAISFTGGGGTGATATAAMGPFSIATGTTSVLVTSGGTGYTSAPTVSFSGGGGNGAAATATTAQSIASITVTNGGNGYTSTPKVTISAPPLGPAATAVATAPAVALQPKAIQELFTLDYGRMNATLGVELPFTNFATQTTIPYGYVDPPTEIFGSNETQYWKITHNGVDTHFIHFHLFNVQVINRVGWDGAVKSPDANELSWKDTVRMNPLEDIIVALRPLKQTLPWDLPNSVRPLDVTAPVGSTSTMAFANIDPANQPATVVNDMTNFGWEYVWHCHILGHEENDMMRAMILGVAPKAPSNLAHPSGDTLTWTDNSLNETGFTVETAPATCAGNPLVCTPTGPFVFAGTCPAAAGSGTLVTCKNGGFIKGKNNNTLYQVRANNVVGYTRPYTLPITGWPHPSYDSTPSNPTQ